MFYSDQIKEEKVFLSEQEAKHCLKVLRKKPGDNVVVLDGAGNIYHGIIKETGKDEVMVQVSQVQSQEKKNKPVIAFGMIKNMGRIEWMLEKLTEIGVDSIIPVVCQRSERRVLNLERCEKIIISAVKQSMQLYKPSILSPMKFFDFLKQEYRQGKFIASYSQDAGQLNSVHKTLEAGVILIGPEGDFTNEELERAIKAGYQRVNLGLNRLRTETAAIVACTLLQDSFK